MTNGKVAVVTGGTRGIGRAITLALANSGWRVFVIHARNRDAADSLTAEAAKEGLQISCLRFDLGDPDAVETSLSTIKSEVVRVDALIHCAASGVHRPAMELTRKHFAWTFEINLFAIHTLVTKLISTIPNGGRIIGITSSGSTRALPYYAVIGSSKGALEALFRHYAKELAPQGIVVNLICPGLVVTEAIESFPDTDERLQATVSKTPTGRLTTPEDVAALVLFLCTEAAAQIVGQTITIDGGRTLL